MFLFFSVKMGWVTYGIYLHQHCLLSDTQIPLTAKIDSNAQTILKVDGSMS